MMEQVKHTGESLAVQVNDLVTIPRGCFGVCESITASQFQKSRVTVTLQQR